MNYSQDYLENRSHPGPVESYLLTEPAGLEPVHHHHHHSHCHADADNLPEPVPRILSPLDQNPSAYYKTGDSATRPSVSRRVTVDARAKPVRKSSRKRVVIPVAILACFLAIGAVLGGVLGTMLTIKDPGSATNPAGLPYNTDVGSAAKVHNSSQLATALVETTVSSYRIILFQDTDGELTAIEWRGSTSDTYLVNERSGDAKPPKPQPGTTFHLASFGFDGDLHLFYIDEALHIAHVVRRATAKGKNSWEIGSLSTSEAQSKLPYHPAETLRLSVTVLEARATKMADKSIVIMYQTDTGAGSMMLVSTMSPDDADAWICEAFSLGAEQLGLHLHPESPGFLLLPVKRTSVEDEEEEEEEEVGVRMIWDLEGESHKTTFGVFDCTFTMQHTLERCSQALNRWMDSEAEKRILDAPKPLRFSALYLALDNISMPNKYLMRVLDRTGNLIEIHWEDTAWTGSDIFHADAKSIPEGVTTNLTGIASADDGLLYAVSDGMLLEFQREYAWWSDRHTPGQPVDWKLLGVVDTEVPEDG